MDIVDTYKEVGKCHRQITGFVNTLLADVCKDLQMISRTPQQLSLLEALCNVSWWESYIPKHKELKDYRRPTKNAVLQQDLADYLGFEPPTVCAMLLRLEAEDSSLITKYNNTSGKWRAVWVEITPYGEKLTEKIRQGVNRKIRQMNLSELSADCISELKAFSNSLDSVKPV